MSKNKDEVLPVLTQANYHAAIHRKYFGGGTTLWEPKGGEHFTTIPHGGKLFRVEAVTGTRCMAVDLDDERKDIIVIPLEHIAREAYHGSIYIHIPEDLLRRK